MRWNNMDDTQNTFHTPHNDDTNASIDVNNNVDLTYVI